jgi:hypothetical protein
MRRTLRWIESQSFMGWGCSECGWLFKPSGGPTGTSMDEMTQAFVLRRDKDFAAHFCLEHPKQQQFPSENPAPKGWENGMTEGRQKSEDEFEIRRKRFFRK